MDIADKVALVTGGGGGIGGAIAAELARRGAKVVIADIDTDQTQRMIDDIVAGGGRALGLKLDVTSQADFDAAREAIEGTFGPLDILVSNAGVGNPGKLGELTVEAFQWVQDVNLNATVRALRSFLPGMRARGTEAHILVTSSITALRPFVGNAAYTSSKAALLNLALVLEMELAESAIGVSALCPGIVATQLGENAKAAKPDALRGDGQEAQGSSMLASGMAPEAVARAAVDAIASRQFYVFPHVDYRDVIAAEQRFILAAMEEQAQQGYIEPSALTKPIR